MTLLSIEESYIKKYNDKWTNFIFQINNWDTCTISNPNLQFNNKIIINNIFSNKITNYGWKHCLCIVWYTVEIISLDFVVTSFRYRVKLNKNIFNFGSFFGMFLWFQFWLFFVLFLLFKYQIVD